MSESTPLIQSQYSYKNDDEEEAAPAPPAAAAARGDRLGSRVRPSMSWVNKALFTITGLILFCAFLYLPYYFTPKAISLSKIANVQTLYTEFDNPFKRLIFVGDIHGNYMEFTKLLHKVKYNSELDKLVVLGDFVTKGPDSIKTLDYLVKHNVQCIMGNHEFETLKFYTQFHHLDAPTFSNTDSANKYKSLPTSITQDITFNDDFRLAKKLQPEHVKYINSCPVILHFPKLEIVAVHGGLRPDLTLAEQDPLDNLDMRALIGPFFNETTDDPHTPNSVRWYKLYNKADGAVPANNIVYYGHDAGKGLNLRKFTKGLDSGCNKGKKLSAMIVTSEKRKNGKIELVEELVQVQC